MVDMDLKVRENRLRRKLARMGLMLVKSRRRDPDSIDFGGYMICDENNHLVAGGSPVAFSLDLEQAEGWIADLAKKRRKGAK